MIVYAFRGNVLLIANVASKCGLTNINYDQLIDLDEKYRNQGLRILAFPCNQFAGQVKYLFDFEMYLRNSSSFWRR